MPTSEPDMPAAPVSRGLLLADVPGDGRHVSIRARPEELAGLAHFADVEAVTAFEAELDVRPWGKHGFQVAGLVTADIVQSCVVSLEPVAARVEEAVSLKLAPASDAERYAPKPGDDVAVDYEADDLPDFFDGPAIDIGAIAVEFFVLGIDPYPRKPGVDFEPLPDPDAAEVSPFAKLAVLKPKTP
eukprot:gene21519-22403_t